MATVPHSERQVTILKEGNAISSHVTYQKIGRHEHLGRLSKGDDYEGVLEEALTVRKLGEDELDTPVLYFTKKGSFLINKPEIKMITIEFKEYIGTYFDIAENIFERIQVLREISKSPASFIGVCQAREILSNDEIEMGILENGRTIIEHDDGLYEIDITSFIKLGDKENPLLEILGPIGIPSLYDDIQKRLKDIIEKMGE